MVSGNCAPGPHHSHRQHATAMDREGYALGGPLQAGLAESVHGSCAAARPRGEEGAMRDTQRPFASGAARKAARTRRGGLGDEAGMARPHLRAWVRGDKHLVDRLPSSAKPPSPAPTVRKTVSQHRQYCHYRTKVNVRDVSGKVNGVVKTVFCLVKSPLFVRGVVKTIFLSEKHGEHNCKEREIDSFR